MILLLRESIISYILLPMVRDDREANICISFLTLPVATAQRLTIFVGTVEIHLVKYNCLETCLEIIKASGMVLQDP